MKKIIEYFVYILTNNKKSMFYVGQSNNLIRRTWQHKHKLINGFTKKYNLDKLVYYEIYVTLEQALKREKQLKGWTKVKKINLIKKINPELKDFSDDWWHKNLM
ncbi:MAG: GIY-YIG nuclease family protein [Patescibacteria group bacterium]|nr:GIY-YIG nuclease family protein [Patescibacteria group bacterium]